MYAHCLQADTSRVIYAWNSNDPTDDDPEAIAYHGTTNRGAASLNLLSGVTNPPQDDGNLQSFTIQVENVRSSYMPAMHALPALAALCM